MAERRRRIFLDHHPPQNPARRLQTRAHLEAEIAGYIKEHNKSAKPFVWTKSAKAIFEKLAAVPEPSV